MIILATTSIFRIEFFKRSGIPFKNIESNFNEYIENRPDNPIELVKFLSFKKAEEVSNKYNNDNNNLVLGFDTINVMNGKIIEKPKNYDEAFERLLNYSKKKILAVTGISGIKNNNKITKINICEFYMNELNNKEIKQYLDNDKNKGYLKRPCGFDILHPLSIDFVEKVKGDLSHYIYGIPIKETMEIIKELS